MRIATVLKAAAVALAVLAVTTPTIAQPETAEGGDRIPRPINSDPLIDELDFPGGTVEGFVKVLRDAAGDQPVNIVYPPEGAALNVPAVNLRGVDVYTALRSASDRSTRTETHLDDGRVFTWSVTKIDGEASPVYTIYVRDESPPHLRFGNQVRQPKRNTAVHAITELTTGTGAMSADDVLSAIQAALAIEGADDETKIRYHEETGLIFARVTPDQGSVIEQTLMNLRLSVQARRQQDQVERDELMEKIERLQVQVLSLTEQNQKLTRNWESSEEIIKMLQKQLDESSGRQ